MSRRRPGWRPALSMALAPLALLLAAPSAQTAGPADRRESPGLTAEAGAPRQVLVMLRMPPPHFRPGADAGGYGAGANGDPGRPARRRVAQDLAREHGLRIVDDWPMPVVGVDCFVMEGARAADEALVAALERDARVAWAQPVNLFEAMGRASGADPLAPLQPDVRFWQAEALHRASTGAGVTVAVIDSGVDARHPDLAGQLQATENFVDDGDAPPEAHGTAVAGIVAARAGNGLGIAGVAPQARLLALRACWETPAAGMGAAAGQGARCSGFTLAKALHAALLRRARIINLSLAGPPDRLLGTLVQAAAERGATVVGAVDPARPDAFPAALPGVLAVAMPSAGRGAAPGTLTAPGADLPACLPGARWGFVSGNSYAAAEVSGLTALLAQLLPRAGPATLRSYIVTRPSSSQLERIAKRSADPRTGVTIDACASIARAAGTCVCSCHPVDKLKANLSP